MRVPLSQIQGVDAELLAGGGEAGKRGQGAAAVARQRGMTGSTYTGLNLASFRGSSELEFGCDSAYLLAPGEGGLVAMHCGKNRYGAVDDILIAFNPATQTFTAAPAGLEAFDDAVPAAPRGKQAKRGPR